jgi:hypothetical protein
VAAVLRIRFAEIADRSASIIVFFPVDGAREGLLSFRVGWLAGFFAVSGRVRGMKPCTSCDEEKRKGNAS